MVISILTLFPDMICQPLNFSIVRRAREKNLVSIRIINIRDFAADNYGTVDDRPFGGGVGMIIKVDIVDRALHQTKIAYPDNPSHTILLDPCGLTYTQKHARRLATYSHLIIICGHYEGVDARVRKLVDETISIGPYITTGGEIPALAIVDSVVRLCPGVLKDTATRDESFESGLLSPPQFTRPQVYKNLRVPKVLLQGNRRKIAAWQKSQAKSVI